MKAQINKLNESAIVVSLFNDKRVVNQKWFDTLKKAENFCKKYNYEICNMSKTINNSMQYEQ